MPLGAVAGGFLATRLGFAPIAGLGVVLTGAGFAGMASWGADPGFVALTLPLFVAGLGFGLIIAPVHTAVLNEEEAERATVAALLTVVRLLGALVGVALLTTRGLSGFYAAAGEVALDDPRFDAVLRGLQVESFQDTFLVTAIVCFVTLLPALFLGKRRVRPGGPQAAD